MSRGKIIPGLYTFAEAASRLGVGLAQAYRLDNEDKFPVPVITLGAVRKVRVAELEAFLQGTAPTPAPGCPMAEEEVAEAAEALLSATTLCGPLPHRTLTTECNK